MKVAILAGGKGSRLAEETSVRPKPMVEIGGRPILWHIMKHYRHFGHQDFYIALGYKGEIIHNYMAAYSPHRPALPGPGLNSSNHSKKYISSHWNVELVETGLETMTGGRIKRLAPYIGKETFMLTWGDGLSDVDLDRLLAFHRSHGKLATLTAVRPPARYGHLSFEGNRVIEFTEKPQIGEGWINGAFFVLEPGVFDYIEGDQTQWEREPLENLANDGQLMAYKHPSFWQCMDTLREKHLLETMWRDGNASWKMWSE